MQKNINFKIKSDRMQIDTKFIEYKICYVMHEEVKTIDRAYNEREAFAITFDFCIMNRRFYVSYVN